MSYISSLSIHEVFSLYYKAKNQQVEERRFKTWLHHIPVMAFSGKIIPYEEAFSASQQKQNSRMTEGEKDRILKRAADISNRFKEMRGE
ncbi:hypothetical protein P4278_31055 [Bacillus thuringiensis]|nr:hypothetical protein [Bacillus thuringiensis]MED2758722.1 hypothetical protein [Bacillus thuringiensis]MED2775563.1 hypothetical protein [Bacillus thuringiensis]MED2784047.1 hypothetical protein [Bacillus thuringiensis]